MHRALAIAALIFVCGVGRAIAAAPVTLQFSYWGGAHENAIWLEVLNAFEAEHPDIRVEPLYVSGEPYDQKLQVMMASGVAPDVMSWEDKRALPLVPSGVFLDLNRFIARDSSFRRGEFYEHAYRDFTFRGQQWGLPWDFITTVLIYNQDLFDQAGLPYPSQQWDDPDWDWQAFVDAGRKLTVDRDGDGQPDQWGFINRYSWSRWRIWMWQNGGLDWDEEATRSLLSSTPTLEALQFFSDLTNAYGISPRPSRLGSIGGEFGAFADQRAAMMVAAGYDLPRYRSDLPFRWDLATFARGPVRNASPVIPDGVAIWADTPHPAEAWQLVKFIVGTEAQRIMAARGFRISPLRSVVGQLVNPSTPQREEVWLDAVNHGVLTNYTTKWSDLEYNTIGPALTELLNGEQSARQTVEALEPRINALLREAEPGR